MPEPSDPALPGAAPAPTGWEPTRPLISAAVVETLAARGLRVLDVFRGSPGPRQAVLCAEAGSDTPSRAAVVVEEEVVALYPAEDGVKVRFPSGPLVVAGGRGIIALRFLCTEPPDRGFWNADYVDIVSLRLTEAPVADYVWGWRIDPDGRLASLWYDDNGRGVVAVWELGCLNPSIGLNDPVGQHFADGRAFPYPPDGPRIDERFDSGTIAWLLAGRDEECSESR